MYKSVFFEISDYCNARCPWCVTWNQKFQRKTERKFVDISKFKDAIEILFRHELIDHKTIFHLYNWGEPFLHPAFNQIFRILCEKKISYGISTNASHCIKFDNDVAAGLKYLKFSMPGFSQSSYDKIHGFKFDSIIENIKNIVFSLRKSSFSGEFILAYHIYQFNLHEICLAYEFCRKIGIILSPSCAYMNDYNMALSYLKNNMDCDLLKKASKELMLYYVDDLIKNKPTNYVCPQLYSLVIDSSCNILTCCAVPADHADYAIGSVFDLSKEDILNKKKNRKICKECIESGLAYWSHNSHLPMFAAKMITNNLSLTEKMSGLLRSIKFNKL